MADDYYVDDFGEIIEKENLADWTDYEPWLFWEPRFNWVECDEDLQEYDRIAWRDNVRVQTKDAEIWYNGARFNIGEIRKFKISKKGLLVCLKIIHSEGKEAYEKRSKIYRHIDTLLRNGAYRAPRVDENGEWQREPEHKDTRPYSMRMKDPTAASQRSEDSEGNPASRPGKSRFVTQLPPKPG